jgi:hypothetical protein
MAVNKRTRLASSPLGDPKQVTIEVAKGMAYERKCRGDREPMLAIGLGTDSRSLERGKKLISIDHADQTM